MTSLARIIPLNGGYVKFESNVTRKLAELCECSIGDAFDIMSPHAVEVLRMYISGVTVDYVVQYLDSVPLA